MLNGKFGVKIIITEYRLFSDTEIKGSKFVVEQKLPSLLNFICNSISKSDKK